MGPRAIFNLLVGLAAVVAIVLVAAPEIGGGGDEEKERSGARTADERPEERKPEPVRTTPEPERTAPKPERTTPKQGEPKPEPAKPEEPRAALPENPDEVEGSQEISLHRPANLRRALRVLERERRRAEGVFDGLRVAPGRIDTTIDTASKKINLQIRPDFKIAFRSESEFPNANDPRWRRSGLGAGAVDETLPARMVRRIDRQRRGSAARDLDYFVIRRDIIDFKVNYGAYLRTGPRPRIFLLEPDEPFRAI